ncbi:hypothetical protein DIS24_g869 [Lasiodiplodia hormozganensis]|uniref:Uncharacterized protein n=1 Tax=Lasiodiplodia hormozganensis TaxID=869390 RepID=A0AA40D807_9PEZI|nr:hypothetical protein DIS24_g869 [Lasiodiplodia hormozganensis]
MADLSESLPNVIDLGSDCGTGDDSSSTGYGSELSAQAGRHDDSFHAADFPRKFRTALDSIWANNLGTFAHSAPINAKVFKDPRINVDGVGRISLPLSGEHAQKIFALSERGILKPNAFRIENPLWEQRVLQVLVDKAAKQLEVACKLDSIGAQLREMQLCNSDTVVEAPLSTDVTDGAIGTLVVCLPSPHQGGDVHVTLASAEKVLKSSELQPFFMCWHHEMKFETRVVSSGYRWTLVYDLKDIEQPCFYYSSSALSTQMITLHKNFEIWKHAYNKLAPLYVYVLNKNVDKDMLSLDVLSGRDLGLARALKEAGHKSGFGIFLARIETTKRGSVLADEYEYDLMNDSVESREMMKFRKMKDYLKRGDYHEVEDSYKMGDFHEMEDVHSEDVILESIFDLSGRLLVANVEVNKEEVLQEDWEGNFDAEETDLECDGFGDSLTATHVFRGTVSILVLYVKESFTKSST